MEEKMLVYVAGNPQAYPIEYYDADSQTYQGVIPELLREFSAKSRYEIVYYQAGGADGRERLAKNLQVDIVSGYAQGDALPDGAQSATVFHTMQDGQDMAYQLCFTQAAPLNPKGLYWGIGGLSLALVLLLTVMILVVRNDRKKLKKARQDLETDDTTGLGNMDYLLRYHRQLINGSAAEKRRMTFCATAR